MLSQDDFTAMLQRYVAGQSTAAEQHLLNCWLTQAAEPAQPELTVEEVTQVRAAMWRRIEEATRET